MPSDESLSNIEPFPTPVADQIRYVIHLPAKPNEENLKVKLQATKKARVDGVNRFWYFGNLETKNLEGWGYSYHEINVSDSLFHTLMGGPMNETVESVGVNLSGETFLRYNSRLPIVVYTPKDVVLHYVIWHADDIIQDASEG